MKKEEAIKFWKFRYENAKDYTDPHWEAQERREHREYVEALRMAIDALQTEVVHGEWKIDEYGIYHCPICHAINNTVYKSYCPNCGAKMCKGGDEE